MMNIATGYQELLNPGRLNDMEKEISEDFCMILRHYQDGISSRPITIMRAIRNGHAEEGAMESHSLKSICLQIGLKHMGDLAAKLEALCQSGAIGQAILQAEELIHSSSIANLEISHYCSTMNLLPTGEQEAKAMLHNGA
ncbi:MAG: hypothetical protein H7839_24515 [Magnetococcus sp. YQC-5]